MAIASPSKKFPLMLWLLSCGLISPLMLLFVVGLKSSEAFPGSKDFVVLSYSILIGLTYSIPVLALMYFLQFFLFRTTLSILNIKILIVLLCIVGLVTTIHFALPHVQDLIYYVYALGTILSSLFFSVTAKTEKTNAHS